MATNKASYPLDNEDSIEATAELVNVTGKLTDWNNEPTVRQLKDDFREAQSSHDLQVGKINGWLDNLNVTGKAKLPKKESRSSHVPKLIRKQAEWRYASLSEPFLSTPDIYNVDPVTYEDKEAAIQNELVLNNQFNTKIQKVKFIDEYVRTAVDEGTVIVKVGWDYEEEINEVEVTDYEYRVSTNPNVQAQFQEIHQLMQAQPEIFDRLPEEEKELHMASMEAGVALERTEIGSHMEEEITVLRNRPTLEVCDYNNLIVDPTCQGDLDKANFIIHSFETSLSELEKDGRYKNLDQIHSTNSSVLSEPDHEPKGDPSFNFKDKPRRKIVAYEYWGFYDIHNDGIVVPFVATWVGDVIRLEENPYPDQKLPFIVAQYLPVRKSVYGEPDGELLEDNQKVIGAVTRGMIDIMGRSANGQTGIRKDALDVTNKRKFDRGMDYEFNANVDPRQGIHMHTFPEIPRSAEFMLNQQHAEAESLTGVKAFHSGITGQSLGVTATGIRSALDATSKRELGILRRLAEGIIDIGRKIIAMNAMFLTEGEVVRITNDQFININSDDLAGNFDLKLSISTAEADNEKAQELAFMLQTMGNSMDFSMSQIILTDIARLRKMPDLAKKIEEYQPQPDPLAQKQAELQIALLEAQVMNERAKGQENQVDVQLKAAKARTEDAKTRNLHSKSDKEDLDFLEQESGVPRQHEMDKMDHDRGTKLDLKAAEALLKEQEKAQENEEAIVQSTNNAL